MQTTLRQQAGPAFALLLMGTMFTGFGGLFVVIAPPFSAGFWAGAVFGALGGIPLALGMNALFVRYGDVCVAQIPWGPIFLGKRFVARLVGGAIPSCHAVQARLQYIGQHYARSGNSGSWETVVMWEQTRAFAVGRELHADPGTNDARAALVTFDIPDELAQRAEQQRRFGWRLSVSSEDVEPPLSADFLVPGPLPDGVETPDLKAAREISWPEPPEADPLPADLIPPRRVHLTHTPELLRMDFMPRRSWLGMLLSFLFLLGFIAAVVGMVTDGLSWWVVVGVPIGALVGWIILWSFIIAWFGRTLVEITPDGVRSTYRDLRKPKVESARLDELVELRGFWGGTTSGPNIHSESWFLEARTRDGRELSLGTGFDGRSHAEHTLEAARSVLGQGGVEVPIALYRRFEARDLRQRERKERKQRS